MAAGSNNIVTDGLVGCWDAGNRVSYPTTGTTWTDLVNSNNATLENMVGESNSGFNPWHGGVFQYDGSDAYIDLGSITSSNPLMCAGGPVSMCLWVYDVSGVGSSAYPYNILKGGGDGVNGYGILGDRDGRIQIVCDDEWSGTATGIFLQDKWEFIVATIDTSGNMRAYLNGVYYTNDTRNVTAVPPDTTATMTFGKYNWFGGYLGPVYIYNTLLTDAEVKQNYEATKSRFLPRIAKRGMNLNFDAGDPASYAGGTTWKDTANGLTTVFHNMDATNFNSSNGGYFDFDGTDEYMSVLNSPLFQGAIADQGTFAAWFNIDEAETLSRDVPIWGAGRNGSLMTWSMAQYDGSKKMHLGAYLGGWATGGITDTALSYDTWYYVVFTWDKANTQVKSYINGALDDTDSTSSVSITTSSTGWLGIGASLYSRSNGSTPFAHLNGFIGVLQLYDSVLSAAEVLDNYNKTKA